MGESYSWVSVDDLVPWERNPKEHGDDIPEIARSIVRFGWLDPIVAWKSQRRIIGGHGRTLAAKLLLTEDPGRLFANDAPGPGLIPVRFVEFSSEMEANAAGLALNRHTERNPMDQEAVAELIREMEEAGAGFEGLGYSEEEIASMLGEGDEPAAEPSDDAPEPPDEPSSRLGEVYELGPHRLVCGDSTKAETWAALLRGEKIQMVWTDPPYGMRLQTDYSRMGHGGGRDYRPVIGDDADFDPSRVMRHVPDVAEQFWWGADYYRASLPQGGGWFVWDKRWNEAGMDLDALFGASFELCWSMVAHKRDIIRILWATSHGREKEDIRGVHPTQKPVALARWFISRWAQPAGVVADPFGGSGTTLLAAASEGRVARLIELDPRYCDVIRRRWTTYADANGLDVGPGALRAP